jgi:hypothetical protein
MKIFYDTNLEREYRKEVIENKLLKDALLKMEILNDKLMTLLEKLTDGDKKV